MADRKGSGTVVPVSGLGLSPGSLASVCSESPD